MDIIIIQILLRKRFEMGTENNQGDKSNGRWTKEEHQKFLLGNFICELRPPAIWQELEED